MIAKAMLSSMIIDHIAIKNHYLQIYFNSGGGASESQCLTPEVTPEVAPMCNCTLGSVGLDVGSNFSLDGGSALATTSTTTTTTTITTTTTTITTTIASGVIIKY